MRILMFYHSLLSDWNHGNAHFLRGVAQELIRCRHQVEVFEPHNSWSLQNLLAEHGPKPLSKFHAAYPELQSIPYELGKIDFDRVLENADLVLVHEWNDPDLVRRIGDHRRRVGGYQLFFHDTHHRMVTAPETMAQYDLSNYDGVLAYGQVLQRLYAKSGRVRKAWIWHEAADVRLFHPLDASTQKGELVWIGNWGDGERTAELAEYLINPVRALKLRAHVHGVRYPDEALQALAQADIAYGGWLPNYEVPRVFGEFKATVHIPRRPYAEALPGIPTIRVFEALACGIPLVCSAWEDCEKLFSPGDFLIARSGKEMTAQLRQLLHEPKLSSSLVQNGLKTIRARHTCAHRVDELLNIVKQTGKGRTV